MTMKSNITHCISASKEIPQCFIVTECYVSVYQKFLQSKYMFEIYKKINYNIVYFVIFYFNKNFLLMDGRQLCKL